MFRMCHSLIFVALSHLCIVVVYQGVVCCFPSTLPDFIHFNVTQSKLDFAGTILSLDGRLW